MLRSSIDERFLPVQQTDFATTSSTLYPARAGDYSHLKAGGGTLIVGGGLLMLSSSLFFTEYCVSDGDGHTNCSSPWKPLGWVVLVGGGVGVIAGIARFSDRDNEAASEEGAVPEQPSPQPPVRYDQPVEGELFLVTAYRDGCAEGVAGNCTNMGLAYRDGRYGITPDRRTAIRYFKRACELNPREATACYYAKNPGKVQIK